MNLYEREKWVDNIKVIACIFVVLGHFFQGLLISGIMPKNNICDWFIQVIYCFHVQLFFFCSGYLYQKSTIVNNYKTWKKNMKKKGIVLGVPYFSFSILSWGIKNIFSNSINGTAGNLIDILFIHPSAPYWYLYTLFFVFLVTPSLRDEKDRMIMIVISVLAVIIYIYKLWMLVGIGETKLPFMISSVMEYEIWFVIGMNFRYLNFFKIMKAKGKTSIVFEIIFISIFLFFSIVIYNKNRIFNSKISFLLGLLIVCPIVSLIGKIYRKNQSNKIFNFLSQYTMPIYIMHTIFAACFRSILIKLGIMNLFLNIVIGMFVSIMGPIIAIKFMEYVKYLDFFIYPARYISTKKRKISFE